MLFSWSAANFNYSWEKNGTHWQQFQAG